MKNLPIIGCLSLVLSVAAWNCGLKAQDLRVGGFLSNGYIESSRYNYLVDSESGSFAFVELGLNASWTPLDRMTVNGQLFAFELGPYGNFEPLVDYLFVDYNVRREFGARFGRIKRELGVYMHVQDIDVSRASVLLPMGVYEPRYRDMSASLDGLAIYGNIGLAGQAQLDYNFYGGFSGIEADGGVAGLTVTTLSRMFDQVSVEYIDSDYNLGGQVWLSPGVDGLRLGLGASRFMDIGIASSGIVPSDSPNPFLAGRGVRSEISDFDLMFTHVSVDYFYGDWSLVAEYVWVDGSLDSRREINGLPAAIGRSAVESDGWYVTGARTFGRFQLATTYSEYYDDRNDRRGAGLERPDSRYTKDLQFSVRFEATDHWSLKAEVHSVKGTSRLFNEFGQNPVLDERSWTLFAAKSTFSF